MKIYFSGFECAVCRSVFTNFTDFEMHETECVIQPSAIDENLKHESTVDRSMATTSALTMTNPTIAPAGVGVVASSVNVKNEVIINNEEHLLSIDGHAMRNNYAPLKYNVSQLDTHEIIIETSR